MKKKTNLQIQEIWLDSLQLAEPYIILVLLCLTVVHVLYIYLFFKSKLIHCKEDGSNKYDIIK